MGAGGVLYKKSCFLANTRKHKITSAVNVSFSSQGHFEVADKHLWNVGAKQNTTFGLRLAVHNIGWRQIRNAKTSAKCSLENLEMPGCSKEQHVTFETCLISRRVPLQRPVCVKSHSQQSIVSNISVSIVTKLTIATNLKSLVSALY